MDSNYNPLAAIQYVQQQGELGRQRGLQNRLAQLASSAYTAQPAERAAIFGQMAQVDPTSAFQAEEAFGKRDNSRIANLAAKARYVVNMAKAGQSQAVAGIYPQLAQEARQLGLGDVPLEWSDEFIPGLEQLASYQARPDEGAPAGYRQFQMMAEAAGLKPGTPEYQQAAKIALGQEGRASSAGFGFDSIDIGDGRPRPSRQNPRTGALEYYDERVGGWVQLGGPAAMGMPAPAATPQRGAPTAVTGTQADADEAANLANTYYQQLRAAGLPDEQALQATEVYLQRLQRQSVSAPASAGVPSAGAPLLVPDMQRGGLVAPPGIGAGRTKEEEAAATEAAKLGVQLQYLPTELEMRGRAAVDQAVGIERGKAEVEQAAAAPAAIETMQSSIKVIDELLADPDLGTIVGMGSVNPLNYLPGSKARGLIARAEQISGKAFLAAFNQLKGAGAITEKEGEAATRAMARLDRSQSPEDYRTALIDLRDAIAPALARQQAILARGQGPAQPQSAGAPRVQTPDDYARLPSGATYIAPDGSVRRKR